MDMKPINAGKLRSAGYDARERVLRVEFDDGRTLDHESVGEEVWRGLMRSASAWSYYRDNIEEEFTARRVTTAAKAAANPLDDLFR
jgi:hypothetical protein